MGNVMTVGFAGEYTDQESGLIYLRARYYDPATALFLTVDPLVSITRDRYGYADGDPYLKGDPSGEIPVWVAAMGAGAVIGGVSAALSNLDAESPEEFFKAVAIGTAGGAVGGLCYGATLLASGACGAFVNISSEVVSRVSRGQQISISNIAHAGAFGATSGLLPTRELTKTARSLGVNPRMVDVPVPYLARVRDMINNPNSEWLNHGVFSEFTLNHLWSGVVSSTSIMTQRDC